MRLEAEQRAPAGDALRLRAEQMLRDGQAGAPQPTTGDALALIHELRVYQIELELQNTELRRTQVALDLAHERYFELYDSAPVGYLTIDADGRVLELNRHAAALLGLSQTALGDVRLSRLVAPEDQDAYYLHHRQLTTIGSPGACELRMMGAGNQRFWARLESVAARSSVDGEPICRTALTDVSDRRRAEDGLREREAKFRSLFDRAPIGETMILPDGRLGLVNQCFADMVGYTIEELGQLHISAITHPDDVAMGLETFRHLLAGERDTCAFEKRYLHRDSHVVHASSNTTLLRDAEGLPLYFISLVEDIGARRQAEREHQGMREQLATAERMASMGLLAAGLAHEVNNPLAAVVGNLAMMVQDERFGEQAALSDLRPGLLEAQEGATRVSTIVRDLRIFARGGGEALGPVDVRQNLESTLRITNNELRHRARVVTAFATTPPVLGSESRLGQVFLNLLVNAAQAIPEGRADANEVRVETSVDGSGQVVVAIADTGSGIAAQDLPRLFDPFFTTKAVGQGTGLGLSICHRLVAELGGALTVDSVVGKGTVFRVALRAAAPVAMPKPAAALSSQTRHGRILVIDDEPLVAKLVSRILQPQHEVVAVNGGREALALLHAGERFDAIFCDLMMPEMTGMEVHAELARTLPDQARQMILLTGGAFTARGKAFLDSVDNLRVEKPFAPKTLIEVVDQRLSQRDG